MIESDRAKFAEILMGLSAIKPGAKLTREGIALWWNAMQDWPLEEFTAAASHLAKSVEFMPSPFHFEQLRKAGRMTAPEAWLLVLDRARGKHELEGDWNDPTLQRALAVIGGLRVIELSPTDKTTFLERRFCEHFETMQTVHDTRDALPQLARDPVRALPRQHTIFEPFIARDPPALPAPRTSTTERSASIQMRDTQADIRKLAAAGLSVDDIAKVLTQRHVTVEEIRQALEVAA